MYKFLSTFSFFQFDHEKEPANYFISLTRRTESSVICFGGDDASSDPISNR